ncbi:cation:proton antiporter domain-containing protein [Bradyrhizobium australiense]|uniref:cation:proton antiporter domain-containing protein n=1 Tax=Bradyrhizobium australiense TaxID=2721161 RepID=UPI001AEE6863|nr:cation:proton antiporter [Bradyrhizobium australiense]
MTSVWALAPLWLGLALVASLLSIWLRISTALSEIVVGTIAQLVTGAMIGQAVLGTDESWIKFLSGIGAIVLTFLAGAELDPAVFKLKWREAAAVGLAVFSSRSSVALRPPITSLAAADAELACRRCHVDHLGNRGLRCHARVWLQSNGIWIDRSGRLLRYRS